MQRCPTCAQPLQGGELSCPGCGTPFGVALAPHSFLQGKRYQLGSVLGQGGFGITYTAQDSILGRKVAIKELFPDGSVRQGRNMRPPNQLGADGFFETKQNFLSEARTVAQFNHPSIVRVWDVFEENGTAYMVMELLEGHTLAQAIHKAGHIPAEVVVELADHLLDALKLIHQAGLLHRDIKPDNVFLTHEGRVVLIDFGSARTFISGHTVSHTRLVTPGYAPPEQYASQAKFGPYTDLYALGATLYHALGGKMPPPATDRMMGVSLPALTKIPLALQETIEYALTLAVTERPQTVAEFVARLHPVVAVPKSKTKTHNTQAATKTKPAPITQKNPKLPQPSPTLPPSVPPSNPTSEVATPKPPTRASSALEHIDLVHWLFILVGMVVGGAWAYQQYQDTNSMLMGVLFGFATFALLWLVLPLVGLAFGGYAGYIFTYSMAGPRYAILGAGIGAVLGFWLFQALRNTKKP